MYSLLILSLAVHEVGHVSVAKILRVRIRRLVLLPYGGQLLLMPTSSKNMLLISFAGPVATLVLLLLSWHFGWQTLIMFQLIILLFNGLPIWPLDGGQIVYYSLKMSLNIRYATFIQYSFATAIVLLGVALYLAAPLFLIISLGVLVFQCFEHYKSRKYVEALEPHF
ncbi:MAG: hypothetical protein ABS882_08355 [Lysinibacillus sp.]